jgi:hypothetical protein
MNLIMVQNLSDPNPRTTIEENPRTSRQPAQIGHEGSSAFASKFHLALQAKARSSECAQPAFNCFARSFQCRHAIGMTS